LLHRATFAAALAATLPGCTMIENLFFYPDSAAYTRPEQFQLRAEDLHFDGGGQRLHGWWLPATTPAALGSVLHLHGNAANISNHLPLVAWLPHAGFDVLMFDYRGFGRSAGKPTLAGLVDDAAAALAELRRRPGIDARRLVVLGQSIGGATALRLLARDSDGVRLAIIDSAFDSYRAIARDAALGSVVLAPLLPLALPLLPPKTDDPVAALASVRVPLAFVHGSRDQVIGIAHSERLYAAAREPKTLLRVDGAQHLEALLRPETQRQVLALMRQAVA
jgi:fermentation-respiration switch protein FrsA (DUF1100 family)